MNLLRVDPFREHLGCDVSRRRRGPSFPPHGTSLRRREDRVDRLLRVRPTSFARQSFPHRRELSSKRRERGFGPRALRLRQTSVVPRARRRRRLHRRQSSEMIVILFEASHFRAQSVAFRARILGFAFERLRASSRARLVAFESFDPRRERLGPALRLDQLVLDPVGVSFAHRRAERELRPESSLRARRFVRGGRGVVVVVVPGETQDRGEAGHLGRVRVVLRLEFGDARDASTVAFGALEGGDGPVASAKLRRRPRRLGIGELESLLHRGVSSPELVHLLRQTLLLARQQRRHGRVLDGGNVRRAPGGGRLGGTRARRAGVGAVARPTRKRASVDAGRRTQHGSCGRGARGDRAGRRSRGRGDARRATGGRAAGGVIHGPSGRHRDAAGVVAGARAARGTTSTHPRGRRRTLTENGHQAGYRVVEKAVLTKSSLAPARRRAVISRPRPRAPATMADKDGGGSRLDRLLRLLETGSTPSARHEAARQIGELAAAHSNQLPNLLRRVRPRRFVAG